MPSPDRPPPPVVRVLQRAVAAPLRGVLRPRVEGVDSVPAGGPLLLAPNHRSFLDHFLLLATSPRAVWFLGKAELARGLSGRLNVAFGMVPIERGAADRDAVAAVATLLHQGEAVAVFPEGTRSTTGELFRFRSGIARLATAAEAPVVPVGLVGTERIWPVGTRRPVRPPRRGELLVRFGSPLPPPAGSGLARRAFTEELWRRVADLSGQVRADRFAPIDDAHEGEPA